MQSYSGFASLPLPGSTNFIDNQELSLELGMRPCESLKPGLPCPAAPSPDLSCPAMAHVAFCRHVHCTACVAHFHARKQSIHCQGLILKSALYAMPVNIPVVHVVKHIVSAF